MLSRQVALSFCLSFLPLLCSSSFSETLFCSGERAMGPTRAGSTPLFCRSRVPFRQFFLAYLPPFLPFLFPFLNFNPIGRYLFFFSVCFCFREMESRRSDLFRTFPSLPSFERRSSNSFVFPRIGFPLFSLFLPLIEIFPQEPLPSSLLEAVALQMTSLLRVRPSLFFFSFL